FGAAAGRANRLGRRLGIGAAGHGDHGRAARGELRGDGASDTAGRTCHDRNLVVELSHVNVGAPCGRAHAGPEAPCAANRASTAARSSGCSRCTMVASRAIFFTRPDKTVPGPTSTYAVTPSDARRCTTSSQRTGEAIWATSASMAAVPS